MLQTTLVQREEVIASILRIDHSPPQTPEEVMYFAVNILTALHSDFIVEDGLFAGIIYRQRQLFGEEILALNSFESQYNHFLFQLSERRLNGIYQTEIRLVDIQHQLAYPQTAVAHVAQTFEGIGLVHWVYILENEPVNGWRIQSWHQADVDFRIIP